MARIEKPGEERKTLIWQSPKALNEHLALVCISTDQHIEAGTTMPAKTRMLTPNRVGQYILRENDVDYDKILVAMESYAKTYKLDLLPEVVDGAPVEGRLLPKYIKEGALSEDARAVAKMKQRLLELERRNADLVAQVRSQNNNEGKV